MRMKNYKNIIKMKRPSICTRTIYTIIALCLWSITNPTFAQENSAANDSSKFVTGLVRDAHTKEAISAAQIGALNQKTSATTDEKGYFRISITDPKGVLSISAFDYGKREFSLRGKDSIVIDLYPESFTNNYKDILTPTGIINRSDLANSSKSVDDFDASQAITADELIQSKLGGNIRAITRSGLTGIGSSLFIRGLNSLNANAQPLFVVDGVIMHNYNDVVSLNAGFFSNPLANIDVTDIESISVLKDGTSIYGSKAANGVILINTSRGVDMVTKINVSAMTGITTQPGSIPVMNADDYRIYASDIIGTSNLPINYISDLPFLQNDPTTSTYNKYHNNTDWNDQVYQTGRTQSYTINVKGGDQRALYNFSLGYTGDDGVMKFTHLERLNTRFNADINLTQKLTFGLNIAFTNVSRELRDDGINALTSPSYLSLIKSPFLNPYKYTTSGELSKDYEDADDMFNIGNPNAILQSSINFSKQYRFNIGGKPSYQFTPNLSLSSQFDYSLDNAKEAYFTPILGTATQMVTDGHGASLIENFAASQNMRNIMIYDDTRLNYSKTINDVHHINAVLGWRYINNYYELDYLKGYNTGSDNNPNVTNSLEYLEVYGLNNQTNSISNYVNVDYNYRNRYFVTAAMSIDGSSRFGNETEGGFGLFGHSWGVFPSINAAWLASSEEFLQGLDFINQLKIRAAYGVTGNDDILDYSNSAYFSSAQFLGKGNSLTFTNIANSQIQWETNYRSNAGLDASLFNERVALSFDVYTSTTKNLLTLASLSEVAGLDNYWNNGGELSNKGFEFSGNFKVLNLGPFQWEMGMSVGHYKNQITALPDGPINTKVYDANIRTEVGQAAGVFYGLKTKGVFATQAQADMANLKIETANGSLRSFEAGDTHFDDFTPDGIIDENDMQILGDPNPDFYGAFSSKFVFKQITFNALFTYSYGNDVYNLLRHQLELGSGFNNQTTAMLSRWTTEGQETEQPRATINDPMGNSRFSDRWIEDGSFLKLKTLSISYNIPIKSNFIEGLNIWASANNLWTLTNYLGIDPEFSAGNSVLYQGIDAGLLPSTKSYFIGVKLSL